MTTTQQTEYQIVVTTADGDLAAIHTTQTASDMEDMVTALHKEFPTPHYTVTVKAVPYWPH